ncbi:hypothetical protein HER14_15680 [Acidithiobacillus thiooxidans]|uniref:hypothetical protein n=1 Tax=Acidithiobacillus thiooxidans TaxID=930 RepID=UPI001C073452|nr:hypothetical protein [Acidithiobacillus thiooxidans]MBU2752332.1 hypothetical protein [Acidithiobacillus thiooxidans]
MMQHPPEKIAEINISILDENGHPSRSLVRMDVPLDNQFSSLLRALSRLTEMSHRKNLDMAVIPENAQGEIVPVGTLPDRWAAYDISRLPGGRLARERLMIFQTEPDARRFCEVLLENFTTGKPIIVHSNLPDDPRPQAQIKEFVHQQPAPQKPFPGGNSGGFTPGAA